MPLELRQITLVRVPDDDVPCLDYLGEHVPGPDAGTIDIREHRQVEHDQMPYFKSRHYPHDPNNWSHVSDEEKQRVIAEFGSLENADLQYALQDYDRLLAYYQGDWYMCLVQARAEIRISAPSGATLGEFTLPSLGGYGIESDSRPEYFQERYREEIDQIRPALRELGFTDAAIDAAVQVA